MIVLDVYYIKHIGWVYQKKVSTFILAYDFFSKNKFFFSLTTGPIPMVYQNDCGASNLGSPRTCC
jgi:hypothetical protein